MRLDESDMQVYADNELIPLSYSGIADPQEKIKFTEKSTKSNKPNCAFIESFQNPYFKLCQQKLASVDTKKEMFLQEKIRQQEKSRMPSQGFFTSKVAKSPSLYESSHHNVSKITENWLLSDKKTSFFSKRHLMMRRD